MKTALLTFISGTLIVASIHAQSNSQLLNSLDSYVEEAIKLWEPPGFAVTVVKDGDIIFTKGYGVRTLGKNNPVDNNTLFGCMSTTKAFVAAGLAMLVDDGKLNWNDKVIDHLPEFQLKDPYITREINIIDLLTHRTGIGNTDYLWSMMSISSDSALYKMREVDPSYSLRSSFIYQNLFYLAAGQVIERVSGMSWGEFLKQRVYTPLGMSNTYATLEEIQNIENKADAHYRIDGTIKRIDQMSADKIGPAGSMWSSINDIGKWIQFLQNKAVVGQDTLISPQNFKMLFTPHQIVPAAQFYPTQQFTQPKWMTYGLGWFQHDYRGKMVNFHTGSLPGMVAIAGLLQDEKIGVYVMGNLDHVELRHAVMYAVFDLFLDGKISRDWSKKFHGLYHPDTEPPKTPPLEKVITASLDVENYAGTYTNDKYGWVTISQESSGELKLNANNTILADLDHFNHNTFDVMFERKYYGQGKITFRLNGQGHISYIDFFGEQFYKTQ